MTGGDLELRAARLFCRRNGIPRRFAAHAHVRNAYAVQRLVAHLAFRDLGKVIGHEMLALLPKPPR